MQDQIQKGRPGTKTAIDRQTKIEQKTSRLSYLDKIKQFIYSPTGDNRTRDSLNHSEVIEIASGFLRNKPLMQEILIRKFPILFIDESQDTKKELIESLFIVQQRYATSFCLGLFGDTMQRIYTDGKENLGNHLPSDWVKPVKKINYRCPTRVVSLINQIRSTVDKQIQVPKEGQIEGFVRLFIVPRTTADKNLIEANIVRLMAQCTNDALWDGKDSDVKTLTLEHHMAARRIGFIKLFEALSSSDVLRTGLIDGTLAGLRFFTQLILPLRIAYVQKDNFAIARIVKANSPLLTEKSLKSNKEQMLLLKKANEGVISLNALWKDSASPSLIKIILNIQETGLFALPDSLSLIGKRILKEQQIIDENIATEETKVVDNEEEKSEAIIAVFFVRTIDRLGKAIRTGARDALLSDEATPETKGRVFGFHRSMDTFGAVLGPLAALIYLAYNPGNYKMLFLIAFLPGIFAIGFTFFIKEKKKQKVLQTSKTHFLDFFRYWKTSPLIYQRLVSALLLFTLFNSSDVFLLLKIKDAGFNDTTVIGVYIFYNLIYALFSYPLGVLADQIGMKKIFVSGILLFALTYFGMAYASSKVIFFVLFFLYGIYAAATEGVAKAWITNICEKEKTATAIGTYTAFQSLATLIASSLAGVLWFSFGASATFITTSVVAVWVAIFVINSIPDKPTKKIQA